MPDLRPIARPLLRWFHRAARDLPWRRTRDPYAIWVSEVMLQQTQVKTVIPYWTRWMAAFPTVEHLANAAPEHVLKLWEGLGYYSRARNLQLAAQTILTHHGGRFPHDFKTVLALPGIGRYTAGAICSIAFHQPTPILDGNVIRVLTRLFAIEGDPRAKTVNAQLWALAEEFVLTAGRLHSDPRRHSDFNQGIMELGATVCAPAQPNCGSCPVASSCAARQANREQDFPQSKKRPPATPRTFAAFVVRSGGAYLVQQRPGKGVNARLWEFPNRELAGETPTPARAFARLFARPARAFAPWCVIQHSITRFRIRLLVFRLNFPSRAPASLPAAERGQIQIQPQRWCEPSELDSLPFASAHRKIAARLARLETEKPTRNVQRKTKHE